MPRYDNSGESIGLNSHWSQADNASLIVSCSVPLFFQLAAATRLEEIDLVVVEICPFKLQGES
jgi:hypothetical protein